MIKDMLSISKREISEYDQHRTYIINGTFVEKTDDAGKQGHPMFLSALEKNKGFWILKKMLDEDNAYPYQALLLKEAKRIEGGHGILIDELNSTRLLTIVKYGIPASTYVSVEDDWRPQAIRLAASNNLPTDESLITLFVSEYWHKGWKKVTPFILLEEWESQRRKLPVSTEAIIFILVLFSVCYYGFTSYNDLAERKDLQHRIATLNQEKQRLQKILNKYPLNARTDLEQFHKSYRKTQAIVRLLKRLQAVSPTSTILKVTENKILISDFTPSIKDQLKEYSPKITPQGVELTWN